MKKRNYYTPDSNIGRCKAALLGAAIVGLAFAFAAQATVLDNFNGAKTGWTDTLNSGTASQSAGLFTITTANNNGALTYSRKTSSAFSADAGHTLEFRADVINATPGAGNIAPLAILGWVPTGGALLGSGYSLTVGAGAIQIQKGPNVVYTTNYAGAGASIQNTNVTLVLRLTPSGSAVSVNARVYRRIENGVIGQYFTTLFEYTYVDASGIVGQDGNAALGAKNSGSTSGVSVAFDNLQVFDTSNELFDDFNAGTLDTTRWTVFKKLPQQGDSVTINGGQLDVLATIADASGGFAGVYSANRTFKIIDGGRVEFQIDIVDNIGQSSSYSALGYLPIANPQYIYGLVFYHLANDVVGTTVAVSGKGYNEWWGGRNDIQPPWAPPGCRYTLAMTGEGVNCRVECRMEDLNVQDVNDPARVVWQSEFIDTPAADPGLNETSLQNPFPYLNFDGRFTITTFNAGAMPPNWAHVLFDNAVVHETLPPKAAPILANIVPSFGTNFFAAGAAVAFDATGSTNLPLDGLSVSLNGVTYTNGSPGVTITPTSASSSTRHFVLAGALAANVNYLGEVRATDADGLSASVPLVFDTFLASDYIIESEEYNFSLDGGATGGSFIDNPRLIAEQMTDASAYNSQQGMPEVDFHDNRGVYFGGYDANHTFRTTDPVYTSQSADPARAKYVTAGGTAAGFFEEEVADIRDGDWLNYTHTYAAGTYNVFLRQATYKLQNSLVTLERVTSDRTAPNQTTAILGSFLAKPTGIGLFANVPLTDGIGNPLVLRFAGGVDTLRIMNRVTGNSDLDVGSLEQNYMIFVPAADPGVLRPFVSSVSPSPGSIVSSASPDRRATIANRDTSVKASSILLLLNGNVVNTATVTSTAAGAEIEWPLSALPGAATITTTVIFQDSADVWLTNTWTYSYPFLKAANSQPVGSLKVRGFDARMAQTDNGGVTLDNSLTRAMQQLAIPPEIPYDRLATSIVQVLNWSKAGTPANVPGLCPGSFNNIAVESIAYVELSAGGHRFHVNTDDRTGIYAGSSFRDPNAAVLWENPGNTANTTFDFVVEAAGLYPIRCIWEETGGGSILYLSSVNADGSEVLVNDPSDATGVVKAYYPFVCGVATTPEGPYVADSTAVIVPKFADILCSDTSEIINKMVTGGTITIPISGASHFYRLESLRQMTITSWSKVGSSLVINYRVD